MRLLQRQFSGRVVAAAMVVAALTLQQLPVLPSPSVGYVIVIVAMLLLVIVWFFPALSPVLVPLSAAMLMLCWGVLLAQQRMAQQLPARDENRMSRVRFEVTGLVQHTPSSLRFMALAKDSQPTGVPPSIQVLWSAPTWAGPYAVPEKHNFPDVHPGQVWQANMLMKTPHGNQNAYGFDYEQYSFSQHIRAVGSVRGTPALLATTPWWHRSWSVMAQSVRQSLRHAMQPYIQGYRYGGVIVALSLGDQASISPQDWRVFNQAGLTHLVSISGTHVTLISLLGAAGWSWCWRRVRIAKRALAEYWPAQKVAACVAVMVAALYCTVAGWGVPAQRTFLMLSVAVVTRVMALSWQPSQTVAVAAVAVLWVDPWAVVRSGFWLSFGAVLVLLLCQHWQGSRMQVLQGWTAWRARVGQASAWQILISLALFAPLGWQFHEISLISPLSNAYAIPLISMVVTPLSLLLMVLSPIESMWWLAEAVAAVTHALLALMMRPTVWLCELPAASIAVAVAPAWAYAVAVVSVVYAMLPHGLVGRHWGWVGLLPCLCWGRADLAEGQWRAEVLDVGQGSAILVQTRQHALLFDTGVRQNRQSDMGARVIVPFLRGAGVSQLDWLVLSHEDIDHTGGAFSLLQQVPIVQLYASFDVRAYLQREASLLGEPSPLSSTTLVRFCEQGQAWQVDGVLFAFVWPDTTRGHNADSNARSCVLSVSSSDGKRLLLTGDIGVAQETALLAKGLGPHDAVVVGHHGSRTSSAIQWVQGMQATWAVAQVGWWSRFGHPHPDIVQRWQRAGSAFVRTDYAGAVSLQSTPTGVTLQCRRVTHARYWQHPDAVLTPMCAVGAR